MWEFEIGLFCMCVGLCFVEKVLICEGVLLSDYEGNDVGVVMSGGFGFSVGVFVVMGYVI